MFQAGKQIGKGLAQAAAQAGFDQGLKGGPKSGGPMKAVHPPQYRPPLPAAKGPTKPAPGPGLLPSAKKPLFKTQP